MGPVEEVTRKSLDGASRCRVFISFLLDELTNKTAIRQDWLGPHLRVPDLPTVSPLIWRTQNFQLTLHHEVHAWLHYTLAQV